MKSVLFVCLGNICRSPLAEAALRQAAVLRDLDIEIDSAGTGDWHIGRPPDPRSQAVAMDESGIDISGYRARQISNRDFLEYDLICALDHSNLADLEAMGGDGPAEIKLLLDFVPGQEEGEVDDPYYGDESNFLECWHEVRGAAEHLAEFLVNKA